MKKHLLKIGLSGGLGLLVALGVVTAQGQSADEAPRPRLHALMLDTTQPLTETEATLDSPQAVAYFQQPWTRTVFQSYRDNNWEIYAMGVNWTDPEIRLTADPAADITAAPDPGYQHIAFATNRAGYFEIMVMNPDGSGVTNLTQTWEDDYSPAWSPDGTRLAFVSDRAGQPEIYVMNADGSNQTRLTFNTDDTNGNAYDADPAWSPDGTRIAFTSKRTGGYRIWVMNADGSNQTQLSTQPYSFRPTWSPDGTQIAYDCDGDTDGWQELWLMLADGSNQHFHAKPYQYSNQQYDLLASSWPPEGDWMAATNYIYVDSSGTGNYYLARQELMAVSAPTPGTVAVCCPDPHNGFPKVVSVDHTAPQSQVSPLPLYSQSPASLSWSGTDQGGSEIAHYDVETRSPSGAWTRWLSSTTSDSNLYSGLPGERVFFRARATDHALNTEVWPASVNGDAATTFYAWQITGTVEDVRGQSLRAAPVTAQPAGLEPLTTDQTGLFHGYMVTTGTQVISAALPGFGLPQPWQVTLDQHYQFLPMRMPPADNLVTDGDFETASLASWMLMGNLGTHFTSSAARSGQQGLALGNWEVLEPGNLMAEPITPWVSEPLLTSAVFGFTGTLHTVGGQISTATWWYANCPAAGPCQPPEAMGYGWWPRLAPGADGSVHVLYLERDGPYDYQTYRRRAPNGIWDAPERVVNYFSSAFLSPDLIGALALDSQNQPHILWPHDDGSLRYSWRGSGGWSAPISLTLSGTGASLAFTPNGQLHATWVEQGALRYAINNGSGWSASESVGGTSQASLTALAPEPDNDLRLMWAEPANNFIGQAHRLANGTWEGVTSTVTSDWVGAGMLQPAVAPDGHIVLAYGSTGLGGPALLVMPPDGSWAPARPVFGEQHANAQLPTVVVNPSNQEVSVLASYPTDSAWLVGQARTTLTAWSADTLSLQQSFTLPANFHQPTLAFAYALTGTAPAQFTVDVQGISGTTRMMTDTQPTGWQTPWFDVSQYLGQIITVTWSLSTTSPDLGAAWAALDEVSMGSWTTPRVYSFTTVSQAGLTSIVLEPNQPFSATVHGDNFIPGASVWAGPYSATQSVWVDGATLQVDFADSLPVGIYALRVVNPGGAEDALPAAVWVGKFVFLPLTRR